MTGAYFVVHTGKNVDSVIIESILESFASMLPPHTRNHCDVCSRLWEPL